MTWSSKTTYVDTDTGEIIDKHLVQTHYIILKKQKNAQTSGKYGTIYWTVECRKRLQPNAEQRKLFDL